MTALAALIDSVENPTRIRWNGEEVFSTEEDCADWLFAEMGYFPEENPFFYTDLFEKFWADVAINVQANQKASGIPVRTIQEAIDAGEYAQ